MLLSVLRVASPSLDVEAFLAAHTDAEPDAVWHAGERRPVGEPHPNSSFNLSLADGERSWPALLKRTFGELDRLRPLLLDAQRLDAAAQVDFGVGVGGAVAFVRSCAFTVDDLRRFVELGVGVRITAYPTSDA